MSRYLSFVLLSDSPSLADAIHLDVKPSSRRSLSPVERKRLSHRQNPPPFCFFVRLQMAKASSPKDLCDWGPTVGTDLRLTAVGLNRPKLLIPVKRVSEKGGTLQHQESNVPQRFKQSRCGLDPRGGRRHKTPADGA